MTNQQKIQLFKEHLINNVGRFMKDNKLDLIEFNPYFKIYIEEPNQIGDAVLIPVVVTYLHSDGTLGLDNHTDINITELSIHELGYLLDYLELENFINV